MGFSLAASQCLIAPPYFVACVYMYLTAWISDKYHIRGPVIAVNTVVGIVGLCLMVSVVKLTVDEVFLSFRLGPCQE